MDAADLELLKASTDKYVVIHIEDGEVIVAAVHFVSDEDQDVIYDVISSNRPERYRDDTSKPAYLMPFAKIEFIEPWQQPGTPT